MILIAVHLCVRVWQGLLVCQQWLARRLNRNASPREKTSQFRESEQTWSSRIVERFENHMVFPFVVTGSRSRTGRNILRRSQQAEQPNPKELRLGTFNASDEDKDEIWGRRR